MFRSKPLRLFARVFAVSLATTACSSTSSSTASTPSSDSGASDTSTDAGGVVDSSTPAACTPAAPIESSGEYGIDALPNGACSSDATCQLAAREPCPCVSSSTGPYNNYRCMCQSGTWSCVIAEQGGSICSCIDAGDGG